MDDNLSNLEANVNTAQIAFDKAAAELNSAQELFQAARTASFDEQVVAEARDNGINPDNFVSTEHLQEAIGIVKEQNQPTTNEPVTTPVEQAVATPVPDNTNPL